MNRVFSTFLFDCPHKSQDMGFLFFFFFQLLACFWRSFSNFYFFLWFLQKKASSVLFIFVFLSQKPLWLFVLQYFFSPFRCYSFFCWVLMKTNFFFFVNGFSFFFTKRIIIGGKSCFFLRKTTNYWTTTLERSKFWLITQDLFN